MALRDYIIALNFAVPLRVRSQWCCFARLCFRFVAGSYVHLRYVQWCTSATHSHAHTTMVLLVRAYALRPHHVVHRQVDVDTRTMERVVKHVKVVPNYDATGYESVQLYATASDGTKVPMCAVFNKKLRGDASAEVPFTKGPVLLYGCVNECIFQPCSLAIDPQRHTLLYSELIAFVRLPLPPSVGSLSGNRLACVGWPPVACRRWPASASVLLACVVVVVFALRCGGYFGYSSQRSPCIAPVLTTERIRAFVWNPWGVSCAVSCRCVLVCCRVSLS